MKQKIRIWLRNFFGFSRTETNGFIILTFLLLIVILAPIVSRKIYSLYPKELQSEHDRNQLNDFIQDMEKNIVLNKKKNIDTDFQNFDLNKSTVAQLMESGFPQYLAERIVNYRNKVKPFTSKQELQKIYGIDTLFYKEIYPYIEITFETNKTDQQNSGPKSISSNEGKIATISIPVKTKKLKAFDINAADSLQLQKLYGIGPAFSTRIIKYRNYLGGFSSLDQLKEVYGLKQETIDTIKNYTFIKENPDLTKLKINTIIVDSLVAHPYISYKEANVIVNYRKQHGSFKSKNDLLTIEILDREWIEKVAPYLSFD